MVSQRIFAGSLGLVFSLVIYVTARDCRPATSRLIRFIALLWLLAELYFLMLNASKEKDYFE